MAELGPVDIVLANAGIAPMSLGEEPHEAWQDVIDVNLTGVFSTVEIADPVDDRGEGAGGAIVLTSSHHAGINGIGGSGRGGLGYTASKHGVVGLMRSLRELPGPAPHPGELGAPDRGQHAHGGERHHAGVLASDPSLSQAMANGSRSDMVEPVDISNAILWLVSDDARYVTGVTLPRRRGLHQLRSDGGEAWLDE